MWLRALTFGQWHRPVGQHSGHCGSGLDPDERPSAPDALVDVVGSLLALVLDRQFVRVGRDAPPSNLNPRKRYTSEDAGSGFSP